MENSVRLPIIPDSFFFMDTEQNGGDARLKRVVGVTSVKSEFIETQCIHSSAGQIPKLSPTNIARRSVELPAKLASEAEVASTIAAQPLQAFSYFNPGTWFTTRSDRQVLDFSDRPVSTVNLTTKELEYRIVIGREKIQSKLVKASKGANSHLLERPAACHKSLYNERIFLDTVPIQEVDHFDVSSNGSAWVHRHCGEQTQITYQRVQQPDVGMAYATDQHGKSVTAHIAEQFTVTIGAKVVTVDVIGVFAGHGGTQWAEYACCHIVEHLQQRLGQFNQNGLCDEGIWNAVKIAFVDLDLAERFDFPLIKSADERPLEASPFDSDTLFDRSGTTANIALRIYGDLWIANLGNCRALLLGCDGKIMQLSQDAEVGHSVYQHSILKRGGEVKASLTGKLHLNGSLASARALGDHFCGGAVSARPKITRYRANEVTGSVLIQMNAGISHVASSIEIGGSVANDLLSEQRVSLTVAALNLVNRSYKAGTHDHLAAMVTRL